MVHTASSEAGMASAERTPNGFRRSLRATLAISGYSYGYTLTIWGSGAVSIDELGTPQLPQVLLLMAGAVAAFAGLELIATGSWHLGPVPGKGSDVAIWAHWHWLSAGIAIVLVWALDQLIGGSAGWTVAGACATAAYLLLCAAQTAAGARAPTSAP